LFQESENFPLSELINHNFKIGFGSTLARLEGETKENVKKAISKVLMSSEAGKEVCVRRRQHLYRGQCQRERFTESN
jgi:hypothetical protein